MLNWGGVKSIMSILHACGKDMAGKYGLHHWDNSYLKTLIIVFLCQLKNSIYLVWENENPVATFQVRKENDEVYFEKLAVSPDKEGQGIGSYCMSDIEKMAGEVNAARVWMEVYTQSRHAIGFYEKRGYRVCGDDKNLKYSVVKMEKKLR